MMRRVTIATFGSILLIGLLAGCGEDESGERLPSEAKRTEPGAKVGDDSLRQPPRRGPCSVEGARRAVLGSRFEQRIRSLIVGQEGVRSLGADGYWDVSQVICRDLVGDDREEMVVMVTCCTTAARSPWGIFGSRGAGTKLLHYQQPAGAVLRVRGDSIIETTPVYGRDEPLCCPSAQRIRSWRWSGSRFSVYRSRRVPTHLKGKPGSGKLGDAVSSEIERLPVPEGAKRHPEAKGVWRLPGSSYEELVRWYRERLPVGNDWVPEGGGRVWTWCELRNGDGFTQWSYAREGQGLLTVQVSDLDPPTVQIRIERGRGCSDAAPNSLDRVESPPA